MRGVNPSETRRKSRRQNTKGWGGVNLAQATIDAAIPLIPVPPPPTPPPWSKPPSVTHALRHLRHPACLRPGFEPERGDVHASSRTAGCSPRQMALGGPGLQNPIRGHGRVPCRSRQTGWFPAETSRPGSPGGDPRSADRRMVASIRGQSLDPQQGGAGKSAGGSSRFRPPPNRGGTAGS